jgi:hypothetical protein
LGSLAVTCRHSQRPSAAGQRRVEQ